MYFERESLREQGREGERERDRERERERKRIPWPPFRSGHGDLLASE